MVISSPIFSLNELISETEEEVSNELKMSMVRESITLKKGGCFFLEFLGTTELLRVEYPNPVLLIEEHLHPLVHGMGKVECLTWLFNAAVPLHRSAGRITMLETVSRSYCTLVALHFKIETNVI